MHRRLSAIIVVLFHLCVAGILVVNGQVKEVAVTIDDLPLNGPNVGIARLRSMTEKLLAGFNKYQIPAVGFVNESLLYVSGETDARIDLLKQWSDRGVELGNHTFSHLGFRTATLTDFEDDFMRGEAVTRMLLKEKGQKPRYFRHPFLQMGNTPDIEKSFETFISERGYKIAPITIDTMDWMFLAAYSNAKLSNNVGALKRVSDEYIKFVGATFDFCERSASDIAGRAVKQILLLHANELNADNFDALINVINARGYRFIKLEQALNDPFYQYPEKYEPTSDWLRLWAFSKGRKLNSPIPPDFIQRAYSDAQAKTASVK